MADVFRSLPSVGVDAALCKVMEEMEDVLSARARGAKGGGLPEIGGLKGRDWRRYTITHSLITVRKQHKSENDEMMMNIILLLVFLLYFVTLYERIMLLFLSLLLV